MFDKTLVQDGFGQHYLLQSRAPLRISFKLKARTFCSPNDARRFIESLQRVPPGYWQGLLHDSGHTDSLYMSDTVAINALCDRMAYFQQPAVFAVNPPSHAADAPPKRIIKTNDNIIRFIPAVEQLLHTTEAKHFNGIEEARAYLQKLNLNEEQLKGMVSELDIGFAISAQPAELNQVLASSLASGKTAVIEEMIMSATPPTLVEEMIDAGNKKADLGPHVAEPTEEKLKDVDIELDDEFEQALGSKHNSLLNGLAFEYTTDMGDKGDGKIENGKISIKQVKINNSFKLKITDLPGYLDA